MGRSMPLPVRPAMTGTILIPMPASPVSLPPAVMDLPRPESKNGMRVESIPQPVMPTAHSRSAAMGRSMPLPVRPAMTGTILIPMPASPVSLPPAVMDLPRPESKNGMRVESIPQPVMPTAHSRSAAMGRSMPLPVRPAMTGTILIPMPASPVSLPPAVMDLPRPESKNAMRVESIPQPVMPTAHSRSAAMGRSMPLPVRPAMTGTILIPMPASPVSLPPAVMDLPRPESKNAMRVESIPQPVMPTAHSRSAAMGRSMPLPVRPAMTGTILIPMPASPVSLPPAVMDLPRPESKNAMRVESIPQPVMPTAHSRSAAMGRSMPLPVRPAMTGTILIPMPASPVSLPPAVMDLPRPESKNAMRVESIPQPVMPTAHSRSAAMGRSMPLPVRPAMTGTILIPIPASPVSLPPAVMDLPGPESKNAMRVESIPQPVMPTAHSRSAAMGRSMPLPVRPAMT